MDPITCPHRNCGYSWTPRKANPKKCPQCANSLWQSPRPKKKRVEVVDMVIEDGIPADAPVPPHVYPTYGGIQRGSISLPEDWVADIPQPTVLDKIWRNTEETHQTPIEKDSLSEAKSRAEELIRRLQA